MLLLIFSIPAECQWTARPSFRNVLYCSQYSGGTFCVCPHGVFVLERSGELLPITNTSGLSAACVSAGAANQGIIAVGYEYGGIDIFRDGRKIHIPDITLGNSMNGSAVRDIAFSGTSIIACGAFGVSLLDAGRGEVISACSLPGVESCYAADGIIYAQTSQGTYSASIDSPYLQDPARWAFSVGGQLTDTKSPYAGPVPASLPSDDVEDWASADGTITIASAFRSEVSRGGVYFEEHPGGAVFTSVFYNPYNPRHVFMGDSRGTLFEYIGHSLKNSYTGRVHGRIVDMECTPEGDLLILSDDRYNPVTIFDHNGNWHSAVSFQSMNCPSPSQIVRISDYVFLVAAGSAGIFAVDLAGTPLDFSDDRHVSVYPSAGGARIGNAVSCMAMDMDGQLLVGTDLGVALCAYPGRIMEGTANFQSPIVQEPLGSNDQYAQHLLRYKHITDIAVDAANRKWISTLGAGVFLVSADIDRELLHFNERNSPLPSDTVYRINIVQSTGDVYFATRNGVASYLSDVQGASADLSKVLVYPNPVRPGYDGDISVSGLEDGCDVRITDAAGRLVYACESDGGRVSWDGLNLNGHRCASGVYLIFVVNPLTGHKVVKKLLIVR